MELEKIFEEVEQILTKQPEKKGCFGLCFRDDDICMVCEQYDACKQYIRDSADELEKELEQEIAELKKRIAKEEIEKEIETKPKDKSEPKPQKKPTTKPPIHKTHWERFLILKEANKNSIDYIIELLHKEGKVNQQNIKSRARTIVNVFREAGLIKMIDDKTWECVK